MTSNCLEKPCQGCPVQEATETLKQKAAPIVDIVLANRTPKEFSKTTLKPIHALITEALKENENDYSEAHQLAAWAIFYVLDGDCNSHPEFQSF